MQNLPRGKAAASVLAAQVASLVRLASTFGLPAHRTGRHKECRSRAFRGRHETTEAPHPVVERPGRAPLGVAASVVESPPRIGGWLLAVSAADPAGGRG